MSVVADPEEGDFDYFGMLDETPSEGEVSEDDFDYFSVVEKTPSFLVVEKTLNEGEVSDEDEDDFEYFSAVDDVENARATKRARVERMIETAAASASGRKQGNPRPGLARVSDSQRLNEIHDELDRDIGLKCTHLTKQKRLLKTACNRSRKCRQLMLAEAFDNDSDSMKSTIQIARRKYEGPARKVFIREVLNVGHCEDPKQRVMQLQGVDICLSFWTFFYGFTPYMVGEVLKEIKRPETKPMKGDMRLVPKLKEYTILASVTKWFKIYIDELTQDCPEHLEGDYDSKPRKFLGGIKVRGVLYQMYLLDYAEDITGETKFCAIGYFKTIFLSQFGRKTGIRAGNFWVTDAIRSLMGGYCKKCSSFGLMISSMDKITREKGKKGQLVHIGWIKKIAEKFGADQKEAASFLSLVEGDDAATAAGTALPIMRKIAQKFVKGRVAFKIMQLVLFGNNGHPRFCRRAVSAPWVQATGNLQVHCMLYSSIPGMVQYYFEMNRPVPQKYIRWSDGGGDTWNLTVLSTAYYMVKERVFEDVYIKRPEKDHSHNVWDQMVSVQQKGLRFTPGKGALTFDLLMKHLREINNSDAVCVDLNSNSLYAPLRILNLLMLLHMLYFETQRGYVLLQNLTSPLSLQLAV
jgi:hypothetical protein